MVYDQSNDLVQFYINGTVDSGGTDSFSQNFVSGGHIDQFWGLFV